jgi:hypothetical protein
MKTLTEDKTSKKYTDLVTLIRNKYKATYLGAGDNGVALELPDGKVIKVTTDSVELEHAETLANYNFSCIIPIHKVKVLSQGLGYIVMENAEQLTADEKILIKRTKSQAEAYLLDGDEEALDIFLKAPKLLEFLTAIKTAYTRADLDIEEIDYSADNLMNYKGKFVMVDL